MNNINFKDIRNYIHNDLNITKEDIRTLILNEIHTIINREVEKALNDKEYLKRCIQDEIVKQIYRDYNKERSVFTISVMDEIYNKIDKVIHQEVINRLVIELKEPTKEDVSNE